MQPHVQRRKVLVLKGHGSGQDALLETMRELFDVTAVENVEKALELLKNGEFDAVFSEICDFLPLERAVVSELSVAILNTIGEGVCITGPEGAVLWANRKMEAFGDSLKQGICQRSRQVFEEFHRQLEDVSSLKDRAGRLRPRKTSFTDTDGERYYEMITTPMLDSAGNLTQLATVVWDATGGQVFQKRINAIDKAGSELVRLDAEAIVEKTVEERIQMMQDKIIRYAKQLLHFDHFVVRLLNRSSNQLEVLFSVGIREDEEAEIFASTENNGISGYVAVTGRSYICNNTRMDPRYLPGLEGARSSLTIPLRLHDRVIGIMNVESLHEAAFSEDDRQMAEIFGRYIAISLNILDLLVVERYKTTGQAADSLSRQISEPLNEIMTQASLLMEDYIGHDDLRRRLQSMIDNITRVKMAVKDVQSGPKGILGVHSIGQTVAADSVMAGRLILIVDDELFIRQTIADVVQRQGCIVDVVRDGQEAISLIRQKRYDLVISDIKLPRATGYEVFAAARQINQDTPVILMTGFGYDPNHSIVRANREGLTAVLYKPFKVDQLLTEIRQALAKA